MTKLIVKILYQFQYCFKRKETFLWFSLIVFGFLLRGNHRGVSSIIGTLGLKSNCYETMIHFFRSKAYNLDEIKRIWMNLVLDNVEVAKIEDKILVAGDHINVAKEGQHMPGVKKLHQESDNSNKAEFIYGHQFGMIGSITKEKNIRCIPLNIELHDGDVTKKSFKNIENKDEEKAKVNNIEKMIELAEKTAKYTKKNLILILDAFFPSKTAFNKVKEINNKLGTEAVSVVIRAKKNFIGYMKPIKSKIKKKGRPNIYGERIELIKVFSVMKDNFIETNTKIYGKDKNIKYFHLDLIWKPIKNIIRFVFAEIDGKKIILMSSNLKLEPIDIINAYSYRFKIEVSFKMLKHTLGGFLYHFWTKSMPKISKKQTKTDYSKVKNKKAQIKILETIRAIEVYTFINCIVLGILMILSINYPNEVWSKYSGWLRTKTSYYPSPETVQNVLQKELIWNYRKVSNYAIFRKMKQYKNKNYEDLYKLTP